MSTHTHDDEVVYQVMEKVEHLYLRSNPQVMQEYQQITNSFWAKHNAHLAAFVQKLVVSE